MARGKVIPQPNELNLEFYQAIVAAGAVCVQRCGACGDAHHPPRLYCPACFSGEYDFTPVSGRGTVYSYTVSHVSAEPAWQAELPYVTVVVELAEGPRLVAAGRFGQDRAGLDIGARVVVEAEERTEDFAFLVARPEDGAHDGR